MSERKKIAPIRTKRGDKEYETHPSYGLVTASRYTCTPAQHFFGSAIAHHSGVSLSIHTAEKQRSLSNDWINDTGEIIEINMTESQWAQLLSHFNVDPGVPCTLNHVNRHAAAKYTEMSVPQCPEVHERKLIETEFQDEMRHITESIAKLEKLAQELQTKPSVTKADRAQFVSIVHTIKCKIDSCMPFIVGQFNEALDGMVTNAKADVEGFVSQLMRQAGIEALQDKLAASGKSILKSIDDQKPERISFEQALLDQENPQPKSSP